MHRTIVAYWCVRASFSIRRGMEEVQCEMMRGRVNGRKSLHFLLYFTGVVGVASEKGSVEKGRFPSLCRLFYRHRSGTHSRPSRVQPAAAAPLPTPAAAPPHRYRIAQSKKALRCRFCSSESFRCSCLLRRLKR